MERQREEKNKLKIADNENFEGYLKLRLGILVLRRCSSS